MRTAPISLLALMVVLWGASGLLAQTPAPSPEHGGKGDRQNGAPHGFHRSFDHAETWAKQFDDPARDAWQKPEEVLDALHLERISRVADLGAGTGYFSVRIAKRVPEVKVFAVDIEPDMLRYLGERAQREHLHMLAPVAASTASPNLPEPVDLVLVVDTYHHIDNRVAYFGKLRAALRADARLAIVDFKSDSPTGPPPEHRISAEQVTAELRQAGYSLLDSHSFLPRQYFLVFRANVP